MYITTSTGKKFECLWAAVATVDNVLRIELRIPSVSDAIKVFSNVKETAMIAHYKDGMSSPQIYDGYTELVAIIKSSDSTINVALAKK